MKIRRKYQWVLGLVLLTYVISAFYVNYRVTALRNVIHADAAGYYAWLPAFFIYHDADFKFTDTVFSKSENHPLGSFKGTIVKVGEAGTMNKYSIGPALCELPFFILAHIYGTAIGQQKGFEIHYQIFWLIGAIAFVCVGCLFQFRLAYERNRPVWIPALFTASLLFGTNLFHYTTFDAGYSHAFTFGLLSGLLYYSHRLLKLNKSSDFIRLAICAGMIVLVRPFNVMLLIPVLLYIAMPSGWWRIFRANLRTGTLALLVFLAILFIHFLGNYWQTGSFFIYSYGSEKFNFNHSHWMDFLFGFQIGAFIYSPLLMLSILLLLLFLALDKKWYQMLVFSISFCVLSWLLSCWSTWTFGCTLGNRPLTDFSAWILFALITTNLALNVRTMVAMGILSTTGITYNQILHYQYRHFILDWCNMNRDKFMDVFMRTNMRYTYYTADDWSFANAQNSKVIKTYKSDDLIQIIPNQINNFFAIDSLKLASAKQYRVLFRCEARFSDRVSEEVLVIHMTQAGKYHDYLSKMIKKIVRKPDTWIPFKYEFYLKPGNEKINIVFSIEGAEQKSLRLRKVSADLIEYDSP